MIRSPNRSLLLATEFPTKPLWVLTQPAGRKICVDELECTAEEVAHYAIDELGSTGRPRLQPPSEIGSDKVQVRHGDILVSRLNPRRRHVFQVDHHDIPAVASSEFAVVRPTPGLDPRFVRYALQTEFVRQHLDSHVRSATKSHGRVEFENIWNLLLPSPPVDIQRRIADYLDRATTRIDALLAKNGHILELLSERRRSVVSLLLDMTAPRRPLRYCLGSFLGGDWGSEPGEDDLDVMVFRAADFDRVRHRLDDERAPVRSISHSSFIRRQLRPGDLVIEKSGGGEAQPVGCVALFTGEETSKPAIPSNFNARLEVADDVDAAYLNCVLAGLYESGRTRAYINQTTGIQNLELNSFLDVDVPLPALPEQEARAGRVEQQSAEIDRLVASVTRQGNLLRARRQALISAAVTGEVEV